MAVYRPGLGREAPRDAQQNAIDIVAGLTPAANRIGLKQVFQKYGDITVCWLPPVDKRNEMAAYIRYENSDCAKAALAACDSGEVVLNGIPLKAEYRSRGASSASSAYAARERGGYNRSGKRRSYGALSSRNTGTARHRPHPVPDHGRTRVVGGAAVMTVVMEAAVADTVVGIVGVEVDRIRETAVEGKTGVRRTTTEGVLIPVKIDVTRHMSVMAAVVEEEPERVEMEETDDEKMK
ncbi:hypothetical protein Pmar_PMAR002048 [Perkinsus marinus ATCC 50983]|uniref:RRM domain-containing protein n=1 Tax=Perkinsus marinus (strain ATCC 50983 / TXsc) TaxID=423536 RepID=C5LYJ1_PERM5|nr:hypothetical protein Pmar_PMAR002048 [Perkinsus marinus ATCC 50983]EEQ98229.1 hypothetical protein Pmar_PMAR002048 [Perkinsus marinus ATCC 50983]|eukprot:XP_002765512.1 hypothetical protein Pmar_PMAR002048 [Perkinsus marinus ATCC 50983]